MDTFDFDFLPNLEIVGLIHERFRALFNVMTDGFVGFPPNVNMQFAYDKVMEYAEIVRMHKQRSPISAFYFLTEYGYFLVCQVMVELSFILTYPNSVHDLASYVLHFVFLMSCIYYGVEHYIIRAPKNLKDIGGLLLRQSMAKALCQLGKKLMLSDGHLTPLKQYTLHMPSGCNVLEVKYYTEGDFLSHRGTPFDHSEYVLNVEVRVKGLKMLPVVRNSFRPEYSVQSKLDNKVVEACILPKYEEVSQLVGDFLKYRPGVDKVPFEPKRPFNAS